MIGMIETSHKVIFEETMADGSQFWCSESFIRKFLHTKLGWSEWRAVRAVQKLPENHKEILREAFIRKAFIIRDHGIPAKLRVNTDKTQLIYQQGAGTTWNKSGEKQVETKGQDEKWAFTLVPSISASGELLPFKTIFHGKTAKSCPSAATLGMEEAKELGFKFEFSKNDSYWSMQETIKTLVNKIIMPYFERKKKELGLPQMQNSLWKIDCWSVHKSAEFWDWMGETHRNICLLFVPGGCTGVWQLLDVAIQRPLKLSL